MIQIHFSSNIKASTHGVRNVSSLDELVHEQNLTLLTFYFQEKNLCTRSTMASLEGFWIEKVNRLLDVCGNVTGAKLTLVDQFI